VKQNGLKVEREGKTRNVRLNATSDRTQIGESELVLIFVKSTQTQSAAESAALLAGRSGWVLTLQNGMGNVETIAENIPPSRILAGTTAHGATMLKAGYIRHAGAGPTTVGMWAGDEKGFHIARKIADQFTQAGIESAAVEAIRPVIWDKLLVNIGINAITALTGIKNGQILDLEVTQELSRVAVEEAATVARARGIEIRKDPAAHVFEVAAATAANRSSMGQDVDQRRPTEIKAINGFVVREAQSMGITAPVNKALTALVETMEAHY
jgi:2-dehydropantoate 2-reductase